MRTQGSAIKLVETAIKSGKLARASECEICGKKPRQKDYKTQSIVGHHWNGYDNPLDVWWLCHSCNGFLDVHDGSLTKKQAKEYVREKQLRKLFHNW